MNNDNTGATLAPSRFSTLGAMIDVSRGRVLKLDYLKIRFERMRKMGYNAVMLYTEDVFPLEGEPMWGYMRGGYSLDDLRRIKAMADENGLELIPCVETLGHLEKALRWADYADIRNTPTTLLVGEEKSYELIEKIVAFWAKAIGGRRIHVGMDEAFGFAGGAYEKRFGKRDKTDVFLEHLTRVNDICLKHGYQESIIWSDMLYRAISPTHDYYDPNVTPDPAISSRIPSSVRMCYWDYYHSDKAVYDGMIKGHKALGSMPILSGGIQVWCHFLCDREKTLATMEPMVESAVENGVEEFFFTIWGDDGGTAFPDISEEGLFACAELAAGRTAKPTKENCARFKEITGLDYKAMAKLGDVNRHYADDWPDMIQEATILYDDPLYCGNYRNYMVRKTSEVTDRRFYCAVYKDAAWRDDMEKVFDDYEATLASCARLRGVPEAAVALVKVLRDKIAYERGILKAWRDKDRAVLERIGHKDLPKLIREMRAFMELFRKEWYATSQPFGFETVQCRNASALARLEEARRRLSAYLKGECATIEEFDEAMKPFGKYNSNAVIKWN